jgi:CheY-like chemotaxis protein
VLVVEDNLDSADTFQELLAAAGHEVAVAYDGIGALEVLEDFKPHVAFVDLGLPGIDGLEVARRIRKRHPTRPQLLALSGYGRQEDKDRTTAAGFDRHLVKPVDFDVVQAYLATLDSA